VRPLRFKSDRPHHGNDEFRGPETSGPRFTCSMTGAAVKLIAYSSGIYGNHTDDDVKKIVFYELLGIPQIDSIIEDNGRLRRWKVVAPNTQILELTDLN